MDKDKIFNALKQAYASLGLGDSILMLHATMLANSGAVTDENLDDVVAQQSDYLKALQSANDKRVDDARKKWQDDAAKAAEEEARKAEEEKARKAAERKKAEEEKAERERIEKLQGFEKQFEEYKLEQKKALEEIQNAYKAQLADLGNKNSEAEKAMADLKAQLQQKEDAEKAAARSAMILSKAKELGISESRINEGFAIAADADDEAINTYLTSVANNQKAYALPNSRQAPIAPATDVSKEDIDKIAASMLGV